MEKYNLTQTGQEVQDILNNATPHSELTTEVERAQEAERVLGEGVQQNANDIDAIEAKIPSAATSENKLTDKEYVDGQVDDEKTRAQGAEDTLQDNIGAEELRAKAAEEANANDIDAIEAKIPSGASSENKLATESYVNDAVSTASATFRGTFNLVSDLHLTLEATHANIGNALAAAISTADNNDFAFVLVPTDEETPTVVGSIDRYKFNGEVWAYEYTLNNSGFTQEQWDAINSGITSGDVTKLGALPTNAQLTTLLGGKQDTLTFDNAPTEDSDNPVKSGGVYAADKALSDAIEAILLLIPSTASSLNQLADKNFVNSSISTATATPRGTYNLVSDLDLTTDATREAIAEKLGEVIDVADLNDYAFVQVPVSDDDPTEIERTERYKFNGNVWIYEYTLNTSGFTAAQWDAINSGITTALVAKLNDLPTAEALELALGAITQNIQNISAVIPNEATAQNQLADKAYVLMQILLATPSFKGQFTTLAQLEAAQDPKAGDLGIVRTKDTEGHDVFTFYQYKDEQWNEFYVLSYHPQDKPATTGWLGNYPYNGMGRVELPMNMVEGWPDNTWIYLPKNDVVYLLYSWRLQLYAVYNTDTQEGLGLDDNLVVQPANYDIADIEELVEGHYLPFTEDGGVWTITKPDTTTITSTELNNTNIYNYNDPTHHGINVLTQAMINRPNTIYVIQHDYDLNGATITIPANCILEFEGGSLSNGTIIGQKTILDGNIKIEDYSGVFTSINGIPLNDDLEELIPAYSPLDVYDAIDFQKETEQGVIGLGSDVFGFTCESIAYWNGYFIHLGIESSANQLVAAFCDSNHNPLYSSRLNVISHANGCEVKDNKLYVAGENTRTNPIFDLPTLQDHASRYETTDPIGTFLNDRRVDAIGWCERTREWCVGDLTTVEYSIYDENFNLKKTYPSFRNEMLKYLFTGYNSIQDLVYDGYFIYTTAVFWGRMGCFFILDLDEHKIVSSSVFPDRVEPEGIVKHDGAFYVNCNNFTFTVVGVVDRFDKEHLSSVSIFDMDEEGTTSIYVDNNYTGHSYGSRSNTPYKRLSQAIYATYSLNNAFIYLAKSDKPYRLRSRIQINSVYKSFFVFTGVDANAEKVTLKGSIILYNGMMRMHGITYESSYDTAIACQGSDVFLSGVTIKSNGNRCISALYAPCNLQMQSSTIDFEGDNVFYSQTLLDVHINNDVTINSTKSGSRFAYISNNNINIHCKIMNNNLPPFTLSVPKMVNQEGLTINIYTQYNRRIDQAILWLWDHANTPDYPYKAIIDSSYSGTDASAISGFVYREGTFFIRVSNDNVTTANTSMLRSHDSHNFDRIQELKGSIESIDTDIKNIVKTLFASGTEGHLFVKSNTMLYAFRSGNNLYVYGSDMIDFVCANWGPPSERRALNPNTAKGVRFFDVYYNKPSWWNGTKWTSADGASTDIEDKRSGTWASRPTTVTDIYEGFKYMLNDGTSHFPIYAHINGSSIEWYKADGTQYTGS